MEKKTMGTFLAALRRAKGLTQQEVADRLLVSNRAVSRWERDDTVPDITLLPAIADLFEVTVDELLRGERRRVATEPTDSPAGSDSLDDASATPPPEERSPRPDARALRGMRAMVRRARSRYFNLICLAAGLVAVGFVLLLGIAYGIYRPIIGYVVMTVFCIGSGIVSVIAVTRMRDVLEEQASGEDVPRLPDGELVELVTAFLHGRYIAILAPIAALLVGSPLILVLPSESINGVLMWEYYLLYALVFLAAVALVGWLIGRFLWPKEMAAWAEKLGFSAPTLSVRPHTKILRRLNLWQWGAGIVGLGGGCLVDIIFTVAVAPADTPAAWYWPLGYTITALLMLGGLTGMTWPFVRALRRMPGGDRQGRAHVHISGIRNFLAIVGVEAVILSGVAIYGNQETWYVEWIWTPGALIFFALCVVVIFLVAELIRHQLSSK